ncbi:Uncharacterised protein [Mycobacterium tuberculosis]|nr:Uncharacterised protein [Mycobacterium tuberculosis]
MIFCMLADIAPASGACVAATQSLAASMAARSSRAIDWLSWCERNAK